MLSIPVIVMASISFFAGFYHLLIYMRSRQFRAHLTFSILCFAIVAYDVFCIGLYGAASVMEGARWQRLQFISLAVFTPAFIWFVSDYTNQKPGWVIYGFSLFYLAAFFVQLMDRSSFTYMIDHPSIKHIELGGFNITYYEASLDSFSSVQSFVGLFVCVYIFLMGLRYYRKGYKHEAMPLIIAIVIMSVTAFHDALVGNGIYHFVYLMEYGYMAIVLMMTSSLSAIVVDAAVAKEELRKSEDWFRSLVETTSDWVWEVDPNGRYRYASPKVRDLLGYEPEEVLGHMPFDFMPSGEAQKVSVVFQAIIQQRGAFERVENLNVRKDGQLVVLETSGIPFFNEEGELQGYRGIDRDITARRKAEDAFRQSQQMLRTVLDQFPGVVFWKDRKSVYLGCNQAFAAAAGLTNPLEIIGKTDLDLPWAETEAVNYRSDDQAVMESGQPRLGIIEPQHQADGRLAWFDTVKVPLIDDKGNMIGVLGASRDITAQKQIEDKLRVSEERLQQAIRVSDIGIFDHDHVTDSVYWSPDMRRIFGIGMTEEFSLADFIKHIHPGDLEATGSAIQRAHAPDGDGAYDVEYRFIRDDGTIRWFAAKSQTSFEGEGTARHSIRTIGALIDITARKLSEEALKESEEKFRSIVENSLTGIFKIDDIYRFIYVNTELCRITGYPKEILLGLDFREILPESSRAIVVDRYSRGQRGEDVPSRYELEIVRFDGEVRQAEMIVNVVNDPSGNVSTMGQLIDITERKEAEKALRESRNLLRTVLDTIPIRIFWKDLDLRYLGGNQPFAEDAGVSSPEEIIGKDDYQMGRQEQAELYRQDDKQVLESGAPKLDYVEKQTMPDGSNAWLKTSKVPLRDSDGKIRGILGTYENITERKRIEEEREALIEELETKNAELERFTYTVSHDLKSPLVTIKGFLGFIERDAETGNMDRLRGDIRRISDAVERMRLLLSDLLDLSRVGRFFNPSEMIPFDELAKEAISLVEGAIRERRITVKLQPGLPAVYGDRQRLVEVLQNLLDNASKFMGDQPDPCIQIGQAGEEKGNPVYYVRDNGVGFAPEYRDHIFGLFNKLDPKSEGSGVGLALVKRIIEVHGGRIWVESEKDKGAAFYFTLPRCTTG